MPQHRMHLCWNASENNDAYQWILDNGSRICVLSPGSITPEAALLDPEDAFIGAIASCQLLSFVTEAARDGFVVDTYEDHPLGMLAKNRAGKLCVSKVLLAPRVTFSGVEQPSDSEVTALHQRASGKCIISNSVTSDIVLEPIL